MHPILHRHYERLRDDIRLFQGDVGRALEILGSLHGPLFLCAALVLGILPALFFFEGGILLNALLGARGIGVVTHDVVKNIWITISLAVLVCILHEALLILQGKLRKIFFTIQEIVQMIILGTFIVLESSLGLFLIFFSSLGMCIAVKEYRKYFFILSVMATFFALSSLSQDVVVRARTIGDAASWIAIVLYIFFYAKKYLHIHRDE